MANKKQRSVSTGTNSVAVKSPSASTTKTFYAEFKPDYTQVKDDLKRIAILAAIFFVILVVLSFIVH